MKTQIKMVATKLATVGLALAALAAPARAASFSPNGLSMLNGLNSVNGLSSTNGLSTTNGLNSVNGLNRPTV